MTSRARVLPAALAVLALGLGGCSGGDAKPAKADPSASERDSATLVARSPLTGEKITGGLPDNPPFVVKVENTYGGQPQLGLDKADLVVEELVEGGLTRLAAIFYSRLPGTVGHVRSMRATDVGIAKPVGGEVVASGGAGRTYGVLKRGGVKVWSEERDAPGFSSDPAKQRPYNRLVDLTALARKAGSGSVPRDYLQWADPKKAPAAQGGTKVTTADVGFSTSTRTQWRLAGKTWQRTNGHALSGKDFRADTLMVLFAKVGDAGYTDPAGNPVPETVFEGSGRAVILHGGQAVEATWTKKDLDSTLTFTGEDGRPLGIEPGRTWIELVPKSGGSVNLG